MKFNHLLLIALFGVATMNNACKKDEDPDNNTPEVILPGEGITSVKIGDKAQVAIDAFGSVSPSYGAFNGVYTHFLLYISEGITVYMEPTTVGTFNADMPVVSLTLSSPFDGKTVKNIGIGSTKAEVKAAYGEPDNSSAFFGDGYAIGITFIYDDQDKVEQIEVIKI